MLIHIQNTSISLWDWGLLVGRWRRIWLRVPEAFPSWFRCVIFKHCDRLTRGKQIPTVPLEEAEWVASDQLGPEEITIGKERINEVREAIENLPDAERAVVALFISVRVH
jgi:DNA-directed RNA polymerase specialized sigma24 family protein